MRPDHIAELIIDDPQEVRHFLEAMDLSVDSVLLIRDAAHIHLVDTSPLMALNAAGTLAYHYGVLETRIQFLGKNWEITRAGGIEAIFNPAKNIKLGYQNVDVACVRGTDPQPRTEKGAGAERECAGNLFEYFNVAAPKLVVPPKGMVQVFYVMVDERGAVEVSRPVIEAGSFTGMIVRAFVSDGSDLDKVAITPAGGLDAPADNFDVPVIRRQ
ncbi:MAG: hypothetical protein ACK4FJ_12150 [Ferrovibrio sp.]|uniref:hypothetical protein n=1 Tax=Ferrovibrio sp. TaxID=1917215 RepID=UPI00391C0665